MIQLDPGERRRSVVALYGNVAIKRARCPLCGDEAFVDGNKMTCCGARVEAEIRRIKRESEPCFDRRQPSADEKRAILVHQENRCLYCEKTFGSRVSRDGKFITLALRWDHLVPFMYSANNQSANFVAACHVCNGFKGSRIFDTVGEARLHILSRWSERGYQL